MTKAWTVLKLADAPLEIIDGDRGKNYPKQHEFHRDGHCLFLNTGNVTADGFRFSDCQFITEKKDGLLQKGKLSRSDIVMTTRGTIGNVGYYNNSIPYEHLRINSGMVIFRADKQKLLPSFLYLFLRSSGFKRQVQVLRSGTAQPQLPIRDIKTIEIRLPEIKTQRRIAHFISTYDGLIENNRRRIKLLEEIAREFYKEWFVRFRFPGHQHVKVKNGVPEGWSEGVIADFYQTSSGGTPSRKRPEYYTGNIIWVKTQELQNSYIFETNEKITDEAISNSSAKLFPKYTVLVAMYGATIGQAGILAVPGCSNQACCALVPRVDSANYIYAFLFILENRAGLVNLGQGAAQNNISQEIIKNYPMIFPSSKFMTKFIENLSPIFQQIENLVTQIMQLEKARDFLLPKLIRGEIAV